MKIIDSCSPDKKVRRSLGYSIYDGMAWAAMTGLTQDLIIPFALALKATVSQVALLSGIPGLISALAQLKTPGLLHKLGSRKRLILLAVFLQAVMWMPILAIPYLISSHQAWWLIALFTLCTLCGTLGSPAWGSLMSELVPSRVRGRYFGFRSQILGLTTLTFAIIAGAVLNFFSGKAVLGFSLLFGGAMIARFISWHFLKKMYEPPLIAERESFKLTAFFTEAKSSNLRRYMFFAAAMNFAINLAAPFFAVYMLRDLGFSYFTYIVVTASSVLANSLSLTFWGKRADRFGNRSVLVVTSCLIPLVPLLWVVDQHLYWLIPVQLLSGFAWAGFTLCSMNFVYDASPASHRTGCIGCFNALNGIALCLGAFIGGYLAIHLPPFHNSSILSLFILSGVLRAIVAVVMPPTFKEVRYAREMSLVELIWGRKQWISAFSYDAEEERNFPLNQLQMSNVLAETGKITNLLPNPLSIHSMLDDIVERSPPIV
jgi:MFS family permease